LNWFDDITFYSLCMSHELLIKQYIYETEVWEREISYFLQENICFKARLAAILDAGSVDTSLDDAERFQDEFLDQDRVLFYLQEELKLHRKQLHGLHNKEEATFSEVEKDQKMIRREMLKEEELFKQLKEKFTVACL
jgi:hypothetical protein